MRKLVVGRRYGEGVELKIDDKTVAVLRIERRSGGAATLVVYAPDKTRITRVGAPGEPDLTT